MRELTPAEQELVLRYVDGELAGEECVTFETALDHDQALQAEVDRFRAVDQRVRLALPVPSLPAASFAFPDESELTVVATVKPTRWLRLAIAAAVLLAVGLTGRFGLGRYSAWTHRLDAGSLYTTATISFEPEVVCETPEKFASYTDKVFGVRLTADAGPGVHLVGWTSPLAGYNPSTGVASSAAHGPRLLLARDADDTEIVVIFQRASAWTPEPPSVEGLNMFSRSIGGVTLHEITPLDQPVVLDLLRRAP